MILQPSVSSPIMLRGVIPFDLKTLGMLNRLLMFTLNAICNFKPFGVKPVDHNPSIECLGFPTQRNAQLCSGTLIPILSPIYITLSCGHLCRILSRVFVRIVQKILLNATEQEKRIWLHELVDMVQEELPKLSDDDIRRISKELHEIATKIKIVELESTSNSSRSKDLSFRVRINAKSPRTIENLIEDKYIEEICKERSPQKSLREFNEYLRHNVGSLDYHFLKLNEDRL